VNVAVIAQYNLVLALLIAVLLIVVPPFSGFLIVVFAYSLYGSTKAGSFEHSTGVSKGKSHCFGYRKIFRYSKIMLRNEGFFCRNKQMKLAVAEEIRFRRKQMFRMKLRGCA
jgi:hypothetical protein